MVEWGESPMSIEAVRLEAKKLLERLEWQVVADSPTTRYYTRWSAFEKLLEAGYASYGEPLEGVDVSAGCGRGMATPLGLFDVGESKLSAAHYSGLESIDEVEAGGGKVVVGLCRGSGSGWLSQHLVAKLKGGTILVVFDRVAGGSLVVEADVQGDASLVVAGRSASPLALVLRVRVSRGSRIRIGVAVDGTSDARVEATVRLPEETEAVMKGFVRTSGSSIVDMLLNTIHTGGLSRSLVEGYGIALDSSRVSVRGLARVSRSARGSSTRVWVEALAIGDEAHAYTAPFLEIDTGEVEEASHSAAAYRLGIEKLFYLEARGLSLEDAVWLLTVERARRALEPALDLAKRVELLKPLLAL